jgi:hypothetical protein
MLTSEQIKREFTYIKALTGNDENYTSNEPFDDHGFFCDVYFKAHKKEILQSQIDTYNHFRSNSQSYLNEIESYMASHLNSYEENNFEKIKATPLLFDVVDVPQNNPKYDLVLICGRQYKRLIFFKRGISLRVEFFNRKIKSINRTKYGMTDND